MKLQNANTRELHETMLHFTGCNKGKEKKIAIEKEIAEKLLDINLLWVREFQFRNTKKHET